MDLEFATKSKLSVVQTTYISILLPGLIVPFVTPTSYLSGLVVRMRNVTSL